jgi:multiple antibiotic resistance protein
LIASRLGTGRPEHPGDEGVARLPDQGAPPEPAVDLISATILLLIIMDPLGNIPIFHALLAHCPRERRLRVMARELGIAYLVLVGFLVAGESLLGYLGLKQPALGIAGGVVLFLIALRMVFPEPGAGPPVEEDEEPFIVPLAVPMVAGPSAVAAILLLVSREPERLVDWWVAVSAAWALSAAILLASGLLMERLGPRTLRALARLMGMLLIMMAVQMLMDALSGYLQGLG